jgi:hypothetical protein
VTLFPATPPTTVMHDRTAWPFTWTVQAPHNACPQPNFVPVIPSTSRNTHSNGICGLGTVTVWDFPLTVNLTSAMWTSWIVQAYRERE